MFLTLMMVRSFSCPLFLARRHRSASRSPWKFSMMMSMMLFCCCGVSKQNPPTCCVAIRIGARHQYLYGRGLEVRHNGQCFKRNAASSVEDITPNRFSHATHVRHVALGRLVRLPRDNVCTSCPALVSVESLFTWEIIGGCCSSVVK